MAGNEDSVQWEVRHTPHLLTEWLWNCRVSGCGCSGGTYSKARATEYAKTHNVEKHPVVGGSENA